MAIDRKTYQTFLAELATNVKLVAVSKTKPPEDIRSLYALGQRDFGENYVQELADKQPALPIDIRWHFIGHLQSNKVKTIAAFVHLIHSVDSLKLLKEIDKQAARCGRVIDCLLQVHIAREETKFGFDAADLEEILGAGRSNNQDQPLSSPHLSGLPHIRIMGLMGMASFTEDQDRIAAEFHSLKALWDKYFDVPLSLPLSLPLSAQPPALAPAPHPTPPSAILSMGMSADYRLAIREGSNMIRIGSLLFGTREKR